MHHRRDREVGSTGDHCRRRVAARPGFAGHLAAAARHTHQFGTNLARHRERAVGIGWTRHHSTIHFANNRPTVENWHARLNELAPRRAIKKRPNPAWPAELEEIVTGTLRAHHGSMSLNERRATKRRSSRERSPLCVSTASTRLKGEKGNTFARSSRRDMLERGAATGVRRAGHVVEGVSKGQLI